MDALLLLSLFNVKGGTGIIYCVQGQKYYLLSALCNIAPGEVHSVDQEDQREDYSENAMHIISHLQIASFYPHSITLNASQIPQDIIAIRQKPERNMFISGYCQRGGNILSFLEPRDNV